MKNTEVTFFFGAGAEIDYGLKGGESFNSALLRCEYKKECSAMLGEEYKRYALIYPTSTKVYLQTIDKDREKAKSKLSVEDYNTCVSYIDDKGAKNDYYKRIRDICYKWYQALFDEKTTEEAKFFLNNAVFCESLDSKFNTLRDVAGDRTGSAKRVISAYMNVFILMMKDVYDIGDDFEWSFENAINLLRREKLKKINEQNTYYTKLKSLVERLSKTEKGKPANKWLINVATSNYTQYIENSIGISPAYLHGRINWFEDYERLLVYDALEDYTTLMDRKRYVFPFIMIPSGVKPLICRKQIEEYSKFIKMLDASAILCIVGYRFNSEDNHINSIIGEWLQKDGHKLVYLNFNNDTKLESFSWLANQDIITVKYKDNTDYDNMIDKNKIISFSVNKDNSLPAFEMLLSYLYKIMQQS